MYLLERKFTIIMINMLSNGGSRQHAQTNGEFQDEQMEKEKDKKIKQKCQEIKTSYRNTECFQLAYHTLDTIKESYQIHTQTKTHKKLERESKTDHAGVLRAPHTGNTSLRRRKRKRAEETFKDIMAENSPKKIKGIKPQVLEAQKSTERI